MKKTFLLLFIILCAQLMSAQSKLHFGARGGVEFLMPKSDYTTKNKVGGLGVIDFGYTYYWNTRNSGDWGIRTGLSAGYATNQTLLDFSQKYTNFDYLKNEMLYTTSGNVDIALQRAFVEVPVMAAFKYNGFVMDLGLKAQYTIWNRAKQKLSNPAIDAFYVPYNVHVTDELITGVVNQNDLNKTYNGGAPFFYLLIAFRIGYEFQVESNGKLGLAASLDYNVWNNFSNHYTQSLISVAPIVNIVDPVPKVTVNNAFGTLISGIHPLTIGLSIYYVLNPTTQNGIVNGSGYKVNSKRNYHRR